MPIRDGLTVDLDEAKTEPVKKKGTIKYVKPKQSTGRQVGMAAFLAIIVCFFIIAMIMNPRTVTEGMSLELHPEKPSYEKGQTINLTVTLVNKGTSTRVFNLPTPQDYKLTVLSGSGQIVTEYAPIMPAVESKITVNGGEHVTLDPFSWNQTVRTFNGTEEVYTQVPSGTYTVKVTFIGDLTVTAELKISIF
jgi:hypothetical protein